jgi:hypothetical protein
VDVNKQKTAAAKATSGFCYLVQEDLEYVWRRERDSNPRTHYTTTPLAEEPLIATWVSLQDLMAPRAGLEPATTRLTVECSTN